MSIYQHTNAIFSIYEILYQHTNVIINPFFVMINPTVIVIIIYSIDNHLAVQNLPSTLQVLQERFKVREMLRKWIEGLVKSNSTWLFSEKKYGKSRFELFNIA